MQRATVAGETARPGKKWVLDGMLATFLTGFVVVACAVSPREPSELPLDGVGVALLITAAASVSLRQWAPLAVTAVTIGCALAYYAGPYPGIFADTPAVIAGYTLAASGRHRAALVSGIILGGGIVGIGALPGRDFAGATTGALWIAGFWVAFMVAGRLAHHREAHLRAVEQRTAETERTREELARRRAGEERLRIARDLHDSLTHTISVITVQAGVAEHLADRSPAQVRDSLAVIAAAGRDAMDQLRATLGVLHEPGGTTITESHPRLPGLAEIPALLARTEAGGTPVRYRNAVTGSPRPDAATTAYRILQESLANIARHAPATPADVMLRTEEGALVLTVENPLSATGSGRASPGSGTGIDNMRRRAEALGGSLLAGPQPDGGFRVAARLPLDPGPDAATSIDSPA